jgi:hypothetical protein
MMQGGSDVAEKTLTEMFDALSPQAKEQAREILKAKFREWDEAPRLTALRGGKLLKRSRSSVTQTPAKEK